MYLRLGNSGIKYSTPDTDDFMIFAEVPEGCTMSYEKPILVRTKDELDIWFGKEFKEREYFDELLQSGVVLYLYKPISEKSNTSQEGYIDYSSFVEIDKYFTEKELENITGDKKKIYKVYSDVGDYEDEVVEYSSKDETYNSYVIKYNKYIWVEDFSLFVDIKDLPQNLDNINSDSLNNRDSLRITYPEYYSGSYTVNNSLIKYTHPKYGGTDRIYDSSTIGLLSLVGLDLDRIEKGYQTLAFNISDPGITTKDTYITIRNKNNNLNTVIYYNNEIRNSGENPDTYYYRVTKEEKSRIIDIDKYCGSSLSSKETNMKFPNMVSSISDILQSECGFRKINENTILPDFPISASYFYTIPEPFSFSPSFEKTHDILSEKTENDGRIEFYSKTIGIDDEYEGNIEVEIKHLKNSIYRFIITRYDYSEVFEGDIFGEKSERIDYIISKESKLVYCNLIETYTGYFRDHTGTGTYNFDPVTIAYSKDLNSAEDYDQKYRIKPNEILDYFYLEPTSKRSWKLREGKYTLRRAIKESNVSYTRSLEVLLGDEETVYPDFILIPNPSLYNYDYKKILQYCSSINCQALIQNTEKDYDKNYTEDINNRLVYFFKDMTIYSMWRPGYYVYLKGLLGDTYSASTTKILYETPEKDPYEETETLYSLEVYKSNYMVDNGQLYYYRKYFDGDDYYSSGWMRFVLGKISRELEKNKGLYLSEKMSGRLKGIVGEVLSRVERTFSIIRRISILQFTLDYQNNKMSLVVETEISDLVKNSMTLNLTINYNKKE